MNYCAGCEKISSERSYYPSIILRETESTNYDIEKLLNSGLINDEQLSGFHGYTEFAFMQTKGRGRFDRQWSSGHGGVYQSTLFFKELLGNLDFNMITTIAAVAVLNTVRDFINPEYHNDVKIKWPNDVTVKGNKVAGILIKSIIGYKPEVTPVIIGTGINVFNEVSAGALRNGSIISPGVLQSFSDARLDDESLIRISYALLKNILDLIRLSADSKYNRIFNEYNDNLLYLGKKVKLYNLAETGDVIMEGTFTGVNLNSLIKIKNDNDGREVEIPAGEIKLA
ncbi:MAG: biotin--[acetyl-CoA-carboxylase] ligase [Candidatus Wallbacteria bacterium]